MTLFARQFWVIAHRWAGLTIALFVAIAGVTGSLLVFNDELILASRPTLSRAVGPSPGHRVLDPFVLVDRVERQTGGRVGFTFLHLPTDRIVKLSIRSRSGHPPLGYDEVWADPYTGAIRLRYRVGVLADGPQNIMPFLYSLHYGAILGPWGQWAFGIAALIWTLDCFVGFYLTLPVRRRLPLEHRRVRSGWWRRWRLAWRVRRSARGYKLNFDLHRAGGLWLWPIMLVFAWSSVAFNLPSVYQPVMRTFGAEKDVQRQPLPRPLDDPPLSLRTAADIGARLMTTHASRQGFTFEARSAIAYYPTLGLYRYLARTSLDIMDKDGLTSVWVDARNGSDRGFEQPSGRAAANTFSNWLSMLHMGVVGGQAYRIFVSVTGVMVAILSLTGVLIWMKKRSARLLGSRKRRRPKLAFDPLLQAAE